MAFGWPRRGRGTTGPTRLLLVIVCAAAALSVLFVTFSGRFFFVARARLLHADERRTDGAGAAGIPAPLPPPRALHVVTAIFNPANYSSRPRNVRAQQAAMATYPDVVHYVVELAYGDAPFDATDAENPRHLQLRLRGDDLEPPLWAKENLINIAVRRLLPRDWDALAWVDGEVFFENAAWASETLRLLSSGCDAVQPFSRVRWQGYDTDELVSVASAMAKPSYEVPLTVPALIAQHTHHALTWAYSRRAYEALGGLYERDIGSLNDVVLAAAFTSPSFLDLFLPRGGAPAAFSQDFEDSVHDYVARARSRLPSPPRVGFVDGELKHTVHGSIADRQYFSFRPQLVAFEPSTHLTYNADGVLIPTRAMPLSVLSASRSYFALRREDNPVVSLSAAELQALRDAVPAPPPLMSRVPS